MNKNCIKNTNIFLKYSGQLFRNSPEDWTPLHRHRNTIAQAANSDNANGHRSEPVSSMPEDWPKT
jgi:hypothetical protein